MKPTQVVNVLLGADDWARPLIGEASVHRPRRGRIWVASFTGVAGQEWRSTGTADKAAALARAKEFEAAARAHRADANPTVNKPLRIIRRSAGAAEGLTQREVSLLLGLSERAVRAIEQRAMRKLARHPQLQELWRRYQAGELTENRHPLSTSELRALWDLTRSRTERMTLRKALQWVQTQPNRSGPWSKTPPNQGPPAQGLKSRNEAKPSPPRPGGSNLRMAKRTQT